jgi:hypothetical protein
LLPTLFTLVNNIEQCCWTWIGCNNIVQYCWQLWTMWAAKHCSILFSSVLHQPERFLPCTSWKQIRRALHCMTKHVLHAVRIYVFKCRIIKQLISIIGFFKQFFEVFIKTFSGNLWKNYRNKYDRITIACFMLKLHKINWRTIKSWIYVLIYIFLNYLLETIHVDKI